MTITDEGTQVFQKQAALFNSYPHPTSVPSNQSRECWEMALKTFKV